MSSHPMEPKISEPQAITRATDLAATPVIEPARNNVQPENGNMSSKSRYATRRMAALSAYVQGLENVLNGAGSVPIRNPIQQSPMERFCGESAKEQCSVIALEAGVGKLNISEEFGMDRE